MNGSILAGGLVVARDGYRGVTLPMGEEFISPAQRRRITALRIAQNHIHDALSMLGDVKSTGDGLKTLHPIYNKLRIAEYTIDQIIARG